MKRVLTFFLAVIMVVSLIPLAFAETETPREMALEVELEVVSSSVFSKMGYDEENEILVVQFKDSKANYAYYDFPQDQYEEFIEADSLGSYFNEYIKDCYDYERLDKESTRSSATQTEPENEGRTYVLNKNSRKFHYPSCSSVGKMKESNKGEFFGTRDEIIARGYDPCGNCHP